MADDHLMKVDNDDVDYNVLCERLVNKGVISEQDKQQIQGKPATEKKKCIIRKAVAAGQDSIKEYIKCLQELKTQKVGRDVMKQPDGRIIQAVSGPREGLPDTVGVAFSDGVKVYVFTPWLLELVKEEKPVYFKIQYENGDVKFAERGQLIVRCRELNACIHHVTGISVQSIRRGPMVVDVASGDVIQGKAVLLINKFMWSGEGERHEFHGHTAVPVPQDPVVVALPTKAVVVALPTKAAVVSLPTKAAVVALSTKVIFRDNTTVQCENIEKCRSCECLKFQLDPTMLPEHLKLQLLSTRSWRVGSSGVKRKHEKDSDSLDLLDQTSNIKRSRSTGDIVHKEEKQRETSVVSVKDICSNHQDKSVDFHCKQCSVAVCSICFVSDHNGHNYSDLQDDKSRQCIRDERIDLNTGIQTHTDSVKIACYKVDAQVAKICSEVKRLGESIKDDLNKTCEEETASSDGEECITKLMKDIQILTEDLRSVKNSVNVLEDKRGCSSRKLEIPDVPKITFKKSDTDTNILKQQIGRIVTERKNIYKPSVNVSGRNVKVIYIPSIYESGKTVVVIHKYINVSCIMYEHNLDVNNVPIERFVASPEFIYADEKWQVGVYRGVDGMLRTWLYRLTGYGGFTAIVKLVNHVDDKQSIIKQGSSIGGVSVVNMIDWSRLCDPVNELLVNNMFTIRVTDITIH